MPSAEPKCKCGVIVLAVPASSFHLRAEGWCCVVVLLSRQDPSWEICHMCLFHSVSLMLSVYISRVAIFFPPQDSWRQCFLEIWWTCCPRKELAANITSTLGVSVSKTPLLSWPDKSFHTAFIFSSFFFCGSAGEASAATHSKLQHFDKKHKIHYSCGMLGSMLYFPSLLSLLLCVQKGTRFTYAYCVLEEHSKLLLLCTPLVSITFISV